MYYKRTLYGEEVTIARFVQDDDKKYHDRHWQKEGQLIVSMQKVKAEIDLAIGLIIGGSSDTEPTNEPT